MSDFNMRTAATALFSHFAGGIFLPACSDQLNGAPGLSIDILTDSQIF
jgi:hypothetical protein